MEQRDEARVWLRFSHYRIWSWDLKGEAGGGNGLARSPQSGCVCVSLFLGTVRLCKCSVRRRARLSRLLTGRRVHNMSPHSGRQTASRNTDREQSGRERKREGDRERLWENTKSQNHHHPPFQILVLLPFSTWVD